MVKTPPGPAATAPAAPRQPAPAVPIPSAELLNGKREAMIVHRGELYRLRETRNGKLILTK